MKYKNTYRYLFGLLLSVCLAVQTYGQGNPPVNVETMIANNGTVTIISLNKKLRSIPRLGFFNVTNLISEWGELRPVDIMQQSGLTVEIVRNLDWVAGYQYTEADGLRASTSLMYTFIKKDVLMVLAPRIDLTKNANYEGYGFVEYNPLLAGKWRFYSRLEGMYSPSVKKSIHQRSFGIVRAGLSYQEFSFGLGLNFDYFGPEKYKVTNTGFFISADLF